MPRKRASDASTESDSASAAKKPRSASEDDKPKLPRNKRWARYSGSGNEDDSYRMLTENPIEAYAFQCMCPPRWETEEGEWEDEDEDEEDEDDDHENEHAGKSTCDGGKTCLCKKPVADHPDHPWILSMAGRIKYYGQHIQVSLRDPDNFSMYTFNDHAGYGVLEVLQNLFLDFVDAKDNRKEQWVVCEAMVMFMLSPSYAPLMMIDDGSAVGFTIEFIGRVFLSMLAILESHELLGPDSEVKNLGLVMSLYIKFARSFRSSGLDMLEGSYSSVGVRKSKTSTIAIKPHLFDGYIREYASKYSIPLVGPRGMDKIVEQCEPSGELPAASDNKGDPWSFAAAWKEYQKEVGAAGSPHGKTKVGGNALDITAWTVAERRSHSFDNKDPLGKEGVAALKQGMVMQLG